MNIKRNIIFALECRKKHGVPITENVPIRMRVVYNSHRVDFTICYRIDIAKWDVNKQRVKNGCTNKLKVSSSEINTEITRCYTTVQDTFKEFELQDIMPTPDQLKDVYNSKTKNKEPDEEENLPKRTFWDIYDEFVIENGKLNDWTPATFEKFSAQRNHLMDFNKNATFESFNESGLNDYVEFLRIKHEMRNSTIGKQMGFLKWFLRWSMNKNYHQNNAFQTFKPKLKDTQKKVIFLTQEELHKVRDYNIPESKQYLERIRDVFLFCCFTGIRYSDAYNLRRSDIKSNHIEITTVKTADSLIIELNDTSKHILDKYKNIPFKDDKALPVISNQKMNDYLKELGELVGIDEPIRQTYYIGNKRINEVRPKYELLGTHVGRRTFICNALSLGIPVQVVMKWTGHRDYKAMKPYIDIADNIKANSM
jgi:integrase